MGARRLAPKRRRLRPGTGTALPGQPRDFTVTQYEFCLTWLSNGFNASAAARVAYPDLKNDAVCRSVGYENLTKPHLKAWLHAQLEDRWKALHMSGDEALARVALDARSDPRLLFDATGKALSPQDWPDDLANSIEAVERTADGAFKVKLASKVQSRRTILEQTGRLKSAADGFDALAEAIRADISRREQT